MTFINSLARPGHCTKIPNLERLLKSAAELFLQLDPGDWNLIEKSLFRLFIPVPGEADLRGKLNSVVDMETR